MAYPPGMYAQPPGLFGATVGGFSGDPALAATGQQLAGAQAAGFVGGIPTGIASGVMGVGMLAGMGGLSALQHTGLVEAGATGMAAVMGPRAAAQAARAAGATFSGSMWAGAKGAMGKVGYGAVRAADALDPTTHMFSFGGAGARVGYRMGSTVFGAGKAARLAGVATEGGFLGMMGTAARTTMAVGRASGMRAGLMTAGRFAASGLAGGATAVAAAAVPVAAGYAAYKGLEYVGGQIKQGAQDSMIGQAMMNQLSPSVAPGTDIRGEGKATGIMMRGMANTLGTDMGTIGKYAQELSSQKVFQTTRSAKEFREKFKTAMKAVEEIAKVTKSSIDDAVQMFGKLRQQGFYTTADIKAQAVSREAREMSTGVSAGVFSAVGGVGTQMARRYGMRGRVGARLAERNLASVSAGVRSGTMSEEAVMEMGGQEQASLALSRKQMGFLGSSRGRAMIAYSMGKGGAPDQDRLAALLGGKSIEGIVTGAAGRGLGVLQQAGTRESKEAFAKYSGMAMVSMAAAQQKQLYGGTSEKGILRMLGTMGLNRDQARLQLSQAMHMPEQLRKESEAKADIAERRQWEDMKYQQEMKGWKSYLGPLTRSGRASMDRVAGAPLRGFGSSVASDFSVSYGRLTRAVTGDDTYDVSGNESLARGAERRLRRNGPQEDLLKGGVITTSLTGFASSAERVGSQYKDLIAEKGGRTARDFGMSEDAFREARRNGELVQAEGAYTEAGARRATLIRRSDVQRVRGEFQKGRKAVMTAEERSSLQRNLLRGEVESDVSRSGWVGRTARDAFGVGTGGLGYLAMGASDLLTGSHMLSGGKAGPQDDVYAGVKLAGLVSSREEWDKLSPGKKANLEGKARTGIARMAGGGDMVSAPVREAAKLALSRMGEGKGGGILGTGDLQSRRNQFDKKMTDKMVGTFGRFYKLDSYSHQQSLAEGLIRKKGAMAAYKGLMDKLTDSGGVDYEGANASLAKIEKIFGEGSPEALAAKEQFTQIDSMSDAERKAFSKDWAKSGGAMLDRQALNERTFRRNAVLKGHLKGMNKEMRNDPRWSKVLDAFEKGGMAPEDRIANMDKLFSTVLGDAELSEEEKDLFEKLSPGAGEKLAGTLKTLQSGGKGKTAALAKELGGGLKGGAKEAAARIDRIRSMDKADQGSAITQLFKDAGVSDTSAFGMAAGGGKSRRGVEEKYIEANESFVRAVAAFLAAMPPIDGKSFGALKESADAVGDAGGGVPNGEEPS